MTRSSQALVRGILAMGALVLASNILVQFLLGDFLTWGALTYPFAFLVNDVMNRLHGPEAARKVVWAGFAVGVAASLVGTQIMGEFGPLVTLRIALGSGVAFLVAQLADVWIFGRLREDVHGGAWWRAPLASTLVGATLDTALFFTIAFSAQLAFLESGNDVGWANDPVPLLGFGPVAPLWISLAVADWGVKLALALVALAPFRAMTRKMTQPVA